MCECLDFADGSMHTCEACASEYDALRAECVRLRKRCEALVAACQRTEGDGYVLCLICDTYTPPRCEPHFHAPGCLCAPEVGPSLDAPQEESRG